ncbi:hypothetical protein [Haloferula sp. BvORR071]|uniref:hypothetical protein n=1 Tax=Haloferula sp. BvORR071 TaxID=1396141 RepID=UPI002240EF53|nr:hypothetical protein [Haloferula sp. BvORR071]
MKAANKGSPSPGMPWGWAPLVAILAGLISYGIGYAKRKTPLPQAFQWSKVSEHETDLSSTGGSPPKGDRAEHLMRVRKRLLHLWRTSPEPFADWELKRETSRLLETLSAAELEAWFKERDYGIVYADGLLKRELLRAWARKDGPGAVIGSSTGSRLGDNCIPAFIAWGEKDHEAALLWLRDVVLPPPLENEKSSIRVNFLLQLVKADLARVEQELPFMDASERNSTLRALALNAPNDPEAQNRLRELAAQSAEPSDALRIESDLLTRMAQTDPAAARARVDAMELEPARRAVVECGILEGAARDHPETAFPEWLSRHPVDQAIPEEFWPTLNQSFTFQRKEMTAWMDSLEAGPLRDQI